MSGTLIETFFRLKSVYTKCVSFKFLQLCNLSNKHFCPCIARTTQTSSQAYVKNSILICITDGKPGSNSPSSLTYNQAIFEKRFPLHVFLNISDIFCLFTFLYRNISQFILDVTFLDMFHWTQITLILDTTSSQSFSKSYNPDFTKHLSEQKFTKYAFK
jgi:hypothetical protein